MRSHLLEGTVRHRRASIVYTSSRPSSTPRSISTSSTWCPGRSGYRAEPSEHPHVPRRRSICPAGARCGRDVRGHLRREGIDPDGVERDARHEPALPRLRVQSGQLLPVPRSGRIAAVVVEVHNTHHERHLYTLRREGFGPDFIASMDKAFYVSPFIEMEGASRSGSETRWRGFGSRSTRASVASWYSTRAWTRAATADRSHSPTDARTPSVRHPQDHRHDPLARAPALAPWSTIPSSPEAV